MSRPLTSPGGRALHVVGDASLVTMDRLDAIGRHMDQDPRIASVSLVGVPSVRSGWIRGTAPNGAVILMAMDAASLSLPLPAAEATSLEIAAWARSLAERGLWHDWLLTSDVDVVRAPVVTPPAPMDALEALSHSSAHFALQDGASRPRPPLSVAVDATWLKEHQTGAQVLTVAAVEALARHVSIGQIHMFGITELPAYARHLAGDPKVSIGHPDRQADIAWYPNQIDGRSDISVAREVGRRVVTTYLDLIAYDIPRYHSSDEAWESYRAFQRQIAMSVDGISTISADVATRLLEEAPRLEASRVRAVPLGIDHLDEQEVPSDMPEELSSGASGLGARPFILLLGNDFRHKNRDFAISVWEELLHRGISCDIVLAGLHVKGSSSKEREDVLLAAHVNLRGAAHRLGHVSNEARIWLLANAKAVHYPTSAEGFGFVPYEAAALGTPSTFTDFGPLKEISGATGLPKQWEIDAHADDLQSLLTDSVAAELRTRELAQAGVRRTWNDFATDLVSFFESISGFEPVLASAVISTHSDSAKLAAVMSSRAYRALERARRVVKRR